MVKLGLVVFCNDSGLGNQTRRLAYMLKPYKLLLIDSKSFSKNKKQNFNWYDGFSGYRVSGFPNNREIHTFLQNLTHVMVCENPLNYFLFSQARHMGIKTYCQTNYEFCDNLNQAHLPLPDVFLMPSHWKIKAMQWKFPNPVIYMPPPIDPTEFQEARQTNLKRSGTFKFLHIVGTLAASDRNGTLDLLKALPYIKGDYQLTIKSQHPLPTNYMTSNHRVKYVLDNEPDNSKLYDDFDALVLPRRYGGLALTCNEALMSAMPVIMPDISPNSELLPREWLVKAHKTGELQTRDMIDVYSTDIQWLAEKMDWMINQNRENLKLQAFDLGYNTFSPTVLLPKYEALWTQQ